MPLPSDALQAPCESCPYRRSVRLAFWSIREYEKLLAQDRDQLLGKTFGCHGDVKREPADRRPCVGWLLDQRRRGTPSIQLRLKLFKDHTFETYYDALKDPGRRVLYSSIEQMMDANYPGGRDRPMQPKKDRR